MNGKDVDSSKLTKFYKDFYIKHQTKCCFETDEFIGNYRSWNCHHLLEKKKYPQYALLDDICVLLTLEMHSLWHSLNDEDKAKKMPKTYAQYLLIKNKYNG